MSEKAQPARTATKGQQPSDDLVATGRSKSPIVLLIVAIFLGFIVMKLVLDSAAPAVSPADTGSPAGTTITSVRNDAVADFDAAVASGRPIYVLFHSLTCVPCVEISEVADVVMPEYEGEVVFVNAITDDPSGQQLAANFAFQYIPTSFFLSPGGAEVVDSFTGAMDEPQMRAYLDALVQAR
ncbi:MAG: thioredoxin family protein [Coriobacteriia bacterium]|nr:thioredoxin family protein [Coriobacteriia bacterium]